MAVGRHLLEFLDVCRPPSPGLAVGARGAVGLFNLAATLAVAFALACCFVGGELGKDRQRVLLQERSFFGVYRVEGDAARGSRTLWHGTTLDGEQRVAPERRREPLTYYHPTGSIGQAVTSLLNDRPRARVAAVGLGDARLSLGRAGQERFDLIVLDAFSSDAIPGSVLSALFADRALVGLAQMHIVRQSDPAGRSSSDWLLATRQTERWGPLSSDPRWVPTVARPGARVWTDQYSDVVSVLKGVLN